MFALDLGWVFFLKGKRGKQVPGSDLVGLQISLAAPSGMGRASGSWSSSLHPGRLFGVLLGGHQMEPLSSSPARTPHSCPAPAKGQQQAGESVAGGHRVSPSSGCYGGLKIAWAVQQGGSIPFFQESQKSSRPAWGGALFVRKALWCLPGAWM